MSLLTIFFFNFLLTHQAVFSLTEPPQHESTFPSDTTVNAIRIYIDADYNTWKIEWLKQITTLRITVVRSDSKKIMDRTLRDAVNGDISLRTLSPGLYNVVVYDDNRLPWRYVIRQIGFPLPPDE